ncbi:MAG: SDR family NAD(P)-dependent oxidoreductase [Steroidobacteraceae bacterium]
MQERFCVITGASSGIGYETALGLARAGAALLIIGRDAARTADAAARLRALGGDRAIDWLCADLAEQSGVRALVQQISVRYPRIDVLINNAGATFAGRALTRDGFERTFALNHLAYHTLTLGLLPLLRAAPAARIVNVASAMHAYATLDFDDPQSLRDYQGTRAYSRSKLANVMFTYALARRLAGTGMTVNCLHPGVVASGFGLNSRGPLRVLMRAVRPFLIGPARGARTSLHLAQSAAVADRSGGYYVRCRLRPSSAQSRDIGAQERLWQLSEQLTQMPFQAY